MKGLTDQERIDRIKRYRGWIDDWKFVQGITKDLNLKEELRLTIADLESWINELNGPADGDRGRRRKQTVARPNKECR